MVAINLMFMVGDVFLLADGFIFNHSYTIVPNGLAISTRRNVIFPSVLGTLIGANPTVLHHTNSIQLCLVEKTGV